jgi:hypothetical protein
MNNPAGQTQRTIAPGKNRPGVRLLFESFLGAFVSLWLPVLASVAAEYEQKNGPATLHIQATEIETGQAEIRLSDAVVVTLSVDGGTTWEVELPQSFTTSNDWRVARRSSPERVLLANSRARWQQTFALEPTKPGELILTPALLRYRENREDDRWYDVKWQPIPVRVTTDIASADLSELRDVSPPEQVARPPKWWLPYAWVGLALLFLSLVGTGWKFLRRRTAHAQTLAPDQWALEELQRIKVPSSWTEREAERFHTQLAQVIRKYLELRFDLPALKRTTEEFFQDMGRSSHLTEAQQSVLREFLGHCDLAKFARAVPGPDECQAVVRMGRRFVEETR